MLASAPTTYVVHEGLAYAIAYPENDVHECIVSAPIDGRSGAVDRIDWAKAAKADAPDFIDEALHELSGYCTD